MNVIGNKAFSKLYNEVKISAKWFLFAIVKRLPVACCIVTFTTLQFVGAQFNTIQHPLQVFDSTYVPDTIQGTNINNKANREDRTDRFYDSLKFRAEQNALSREMHNILIRSSAGRGGNADNPYVNGNIIYSDRTIRKIQILKVNTFGQDVYDTTHQQLNLIQRVGNSTHVKTQDVVIRNRLLFKPGDLLDPLEVADNERLLRELPYIQDVNIVIDPVANTDSVDLTVIVKDVYPLGFSYELFDVDYGKAGLWNLNMFGTGHELRMYSTYNLSRSPKMNFKSAYRINNIYNTLITSTIRYENTWKEDLVELNLERNFLTPRIKYGGGLNFLADDAFIDIRTTDTTFTDVHINYHHYDAWFGRSFEIREFKNLFTRTNFFITTRFRNDIFFRSPGQSDEMFYLYQDRQTILVSIGITEQGFVKSNYVNGFGTTEDIPYGMKLEITTGYDWNKISERFYTGFSLSSGAYYPGIGFIYNAATIGGFLNSDFEQGLLNYQFQYFSPLIGRGTHRARIYLDLLYEGGFNRFADEYLYFRKNEGIRGFEYLQPIGRQKLAVNLESRLFSPRDIYGFRFVYHIFVDAAMIDELNSSILKNPVYTGFGVGLRVRNERLVFNTLQLRFAYYPRLPEGAEGEMFQLKGVAPRSPENFSITPPEVNSIIR